MRPDSCPLHPGILTHLWCLIASLLSWLSPLSISAIQQTSDRVGGSDRAQIVMYGLLGRWAIRRHHHYQNAHHKGEVTVSDAVTLLIQGSEFFRSQPQTCFTYFCHHPSLLCCSIGATTKYLVFLSSYSPGLKTFMWEGENIPNQYRAWIGLGLLWQGSAGNRKKVVEFKETQSLCHLFMLQHQSYDLPAHYASQRSMKAVKGCRAYYKHAWSPVHCIGKEIKPMPLLFLEVTVKMLFIPGWFRSTILKIIASFWNCCFKKKIHCCHRFSTKRII